MLPEVRQLQSIIDYGLFEPAIDSLAFPGVDTDWFWSSTSLADWENPPKAWHVGFGEGFVHNTDKRWFNFARCVRVVPASQQYRFIREEPVPGEIVVLDIRNGLMWQGCHAGLSGVKCDIGTSEEMIWGRALEYCETLNWAGYNDWYMPNVKELRSIVDEERSDPAIDPIAFPATTPGRYLTSTSHSNIPWWSWSAHFYEGVVVVVYYKDELGNVRCVRSD